MTKEETVTITKTTLWQGIAGILFILLLASIWTGGLGLGESEGTNTVRQPSAAQPSGNNPVEVSLEGAFTKGSEDAPVTIVEYSDFQCPFCNRFFQQTLPLIQERYIDTGKVLFVYKDFPLDSIHPQATPAAIAARCAGEQSDDAFWAMHDRIFQSQTSMSVENYKAWAAQIGLDSSTFNSCLDSQKYLNEVRADLAEGSAAGISGTPGFLINGQLVSGAQPFQVFEQVIEAELAKA